MKTSKTNRFISALLSIFIVIMSLFITTVSVNAEDTDDVMLLRAQETDFNYTFLPDGTVSITKYTGKMPDIIVPRTIKNRTVTQLDKAFSNNATVKTVYIPDTVKTITGSTFYNAANLKRIVIKGYVSKYENYVFWDLPKLEYVSISSYYNSVKMSSKTFNNCPKLKKVILPHGLTSLNEKTFYNCESLTDIYIPYSVSWIHTNAFGNVTAMYEADFTIYSYDSPYIEYFCKENNYPYVNISTLYKTLEFKDVSLKSGKTYTIPTKEDSKFTVSYASSNSKVVNVEDNTATALNKGTATINVTVAPIAYPIYKQTYSFKIKVTTEPTFDKATITVSKGKTATVKLTGKATAIDNIYTNTSYAKFTSTKNATSLKIKGLKKGTTTIKVKVNGVRTLSIKVKVS